MVRALKSLLLVSLVLAAAALGAGQLDLCGDWPEAAPELLEVARGEGRLSAGAGEAVLTPPLPISMAGYRPPRSEATVAEEPLYARALVLEAGGVKVGLLSLELLYVPESLVLEIRAAVQDLRLDGLLVTATHTHSSYGGFDDRLLAQAVGTGRARPEARLSVVLGAEEALRRAAKGMERVAAELGSATVVDLTQPRTGPVSDQRFTRLVLKASGKPKAQVVLLAAHPTLLPRDHAKLHPDFPGRLALEEARAGRGLTLVLQSALGNAAAVIVEPDPTSALEAFTGRLQSGLQRAALSPLSSPALGYARAHVALPRPDLRHSLFHPLRRPAENLACAAAPRSVEVSALALGDFRLLGVPAEVTYDAALPLEAALGGARVVSLAGGYLGYLEDPRRVAAGEGESRRQLFPPTLQRSVEDAARLLASSLAR